MKKTSYLLIGLVTLSSTLTACNSPSTANNQLEQNVEISASKSNKNITQKFGMGLNTQGLNKLTEEDNNSESTNSSLPAKADLRAGFSPVYNQQNTNACVGFSTVGGLGEYLMRKKGNNQRFSPRFLWNMGRKLEKSLDQNVGMYFPDAIKVIDAYGMLPEADLPFNEKLFAYNPKPTPEDTAAQNKEISSVPTADMIKKAKNFKVSQGWVNINSVHAMKKALSEGYPVVFGVALFDSFFTTGANGVIPMPKEGEKMHGGHAIVAVGYDNAKKQLIIRNSWGAEWADKGYAYLPYDFMKKGYAYGGFTAKF